MQVFMPIKVESEKDLRRIGEILDRPRLNKQLVECKTILEGGWSKHPVYKMYAHSDETLASLLWYSLVLGLTYGERCGKMHSIDFTMYLPEKDIEFEPPHWFTAPLFYTHHAAALVRKAPEHYTMYSDVLTNSLYIYTLEDVNYLIRLNKDKQLKEETEKHKFNYIHNTGGEIELYEKISAIYKKSPNIYWSWEDNNYIYYPQNY